MRIDIDGVSRLAVSVATMSEQVLEIVERLAGTLGPAGDCWGGDDLGQTFARAYLPAARQAGSAFAALADGLRGVGDALRVAASTAAAADMRAAQRF